MHQQYQKAEQLSQSVIEAVIEVHRELGPGLTEGLYLKCLMRELSMLHVPYACQSTVKVDYKGLMFDELLKFDLLVGGCLLVDIKCVEQVPPAQKVQLMSFLRLMKIPMGLIVNFYEPILTEGIYRVLLPGVNRVEEEELE